MYAKYFVGVLTILSFLDIGNAQDGSYDPTFGDHGRQWIDVTPADDGANTMVQLPNGDFFMAGYCGDASGASCAAWLTPDGALDTRYGSAASGTLWFKNIAGWPVDDYGIVRALALPDNRVVLVVARQGGSTYLAVVRADGTGLDSSIGNGAGYVAPTFAAFEQIARTPQGSFVAVGDRLPNQDAMVVARFDSSLRLDTSFGTSGITTVTFPGEASYAYGMTLQRDGKIVVAGSVGASGKAAVARLTGSGQLDTTFGVNSDGRFENDFGYYNVAATQIVEDKKRRLVFGGQTGVMNDNAGD